MNQIAYFEIQSDSPERAQKFYTNIFGWIFTEQPGMSSPYWQIEAPTGDNIRGGLMQRPAPAPGAHMGTNAFTCSMQVEDFDTAAATILQNGGQVALEKFGIPGKCWQGYFLDPDHNTFGIFQVDPEAH